MPNPILLENNPQLAELIQSLLDRFEGHYDLQKVEDQATLAEGLREIGAHIARNGKTASLKVVVGDDGVRTLTVQTIPRK